MSSGPQGQTPLPGDSLSEPRFELGTATAYIDEPVRIRVVGLPANREITLAASSYDDSEREWRSETVFRADTSGIVDIATESPIRGGYIGASPMGIFWSMKLCCEHADGRTSFAKTDVAPNIAQLSARTAGKSVASATVTRNFIAPGTITRDLKISMPFENPESHSQPAADTHATIGRLFIPPGDGRHPVVIVLSGSGGGFDLDKAGVLSRHGFATFALSYFGAPPLPSWLHRIPLEYFERALLWLGSQPELDPNRIGIFAISRGAELALLLGATFSEKIRAVVACAPSSVAWAAGGADKSTGEIISSWTHGGNAIPFAPLPLRSFLWRSALPVAVWKRPVMFVNLFRAALKNREAIERAAIPIENIAAAVLLVSGGDDHLWPAAEMAEALMARAKKRNRAPKLEHLNYPAAGHMLRYPFLPTTSRCSRNPHLRNARFSFGGSAEADAAAQADYWPRAIAFLRTHL
jgi:dienelactone hydrolase